MGLGMAANLAKAGHDVRAFDLSKDAMARAVEAGCTAANDAASAVSEADLVVTMLPAGKHVRAVYLNDGGVFDHAKAGALCIDCSTIDVDTARAVIKAAGERGFAMIDAPVSGGVGGAAAGRSLLCAAARLMRSSVPSRRSKLWERTYFTRGRGKWPSGEDLQQYASGDSYDRHMRSL